VKQGRFHDVMLVLITLQPGVWLLPRLNATRNILLHIQKIRLAGDATHHFQCGCCPTSPRLWCYSPWKDVPGPTPNDAFPSFFKRIHCTF